ncbi:transketolase family protein [Atopobium fossor]|uniref:transketolase family protein n=1 Tax=Atopobium fossor TaxID=39487 RepID=UPI0004033A04|nr:transketolase C-terminal domain-containing protein [Atopobium fossor]
MDYQLISLRTLVGDALNAAFDKHPNIFVLDADLAGSTTAAQFAAKHPNHFIETGIAEQNAMSAAAGIAVEGGIPFFVDFSLFITGTCWTQIRQACYGNLNVKMIGTHNGMDGGYDGATHHANEDIALMRVIPDLTILDPSNPDELYDAIECAIAIDGPVFIRTTRGNVPNLSATKSIKLGKAQIIYDKGNDFALIYEGSTTDLAMRSFEAAIQNGQNGKLINICSIKPVDTKLLRDLAQSVKRIITVENHSIVGGLGSLVAETVCDIPSHAPIYRIGVDDVFTESGPGDALKEKYGLTVDNVLSKIA